MLPSRKRPRTAGDASGALARVEALIGLAQLQLLVQTLDSDNADGRSTGLLGFVGALAAADLAARGVFGGSWWIPLPGLAFSAVVLLGLRRGLRLEFGPSPRSLYDAYPGQPTARLGVQLLSDLDDARIRNDQALARKERRLALAVVSVVITIAYSAAAFA